MPIEVKEKTHAKLGPSGWDRWGTCPGSVPLTDDLPRTSNDYADEGTAAHELLNDCIVGGFDAEDLLGREYIVGGKLWVVDMDMADAVNTALGWIRDELDEERGDVIMSEQEVPIAHLTGETDATGTSDIIGIKDGGKTLVVMDYKHGKGVQVYASEKHDVIKDSDPDVFPAICDSNGSVVLAYCRKCKRGEVELDKGCLPNGQMAMYALGALELVRPFYDQIEKVRMVIMQPRIDWHDEFEMPVDELLAFGERVTEAAGRAELNRQMAAEGQEVDLVVSDKGCKFCDAKSFCPAMRNLMSNTLAVASSADDFDDMTLPKKAASVVIDQTIPADKLAEMMRAFPMIEAIIKDVRAEVERRLFDGEEVPGFYLGQGKKGNRKWRDENEAGIELTKRLKVDEAFTKKVISPTQAEKKLKDKPKIWAKIAPLITQEDGKPSVCREGDGNPPFQIGNSADAFDDLTTGQPVIEAPADNPFADEKPLYERMKDIANGGAPADDNPFA